MSQDGQDSQEGPNYIFNRDFRSSIRLNYNHWMMKELCGYLIHPKIAAPTASARIADVGTGTGIWLLETAASLPETIQLDGFDISAAQYPPKQWWPKNVKFHTHDAFQPFPEEFLGKYDVVHARFFLCLVNDNNAEKLLQKLASLLKPDGYLQWFEPDANNTSTKSDNSEASTASVERLATMFRKPRPDSSYNWLVDMPKYFQKNGLAVVACEEHPMKDYLRLPWGQSNLAGFEDLISDSKVVGTEQGEAMAKLLDGLNTEFNSGVSLDTSWLCFVGRKS